MQIYPGVAQLTVSTSGAGPGMIITSGSGDPHGWWPVPLVAQGNDARSAANTMAAVQAVTDRTNWIGWRAIDWIFGGDYRVLFRGSLLIGNSIAIDRSYASDGQSCLILTGPTGAGARTLDVSGGGTTGVAARFTGAASATVAVAILGGATAGDGLLVTAQNGDSTAVTGIGHGSGSGLVGTAGATAGTPAVRALSGPVLIDTDILLPTTDPGAHMLWSTNICVAWGTIKITSGTPSIADGFNIDNPSVTAGRALVANTGLTVPFIRPLVDQGAGANGYSVTYSVQPPAVVGSVPIVFTVGTSRAELIIGAQLNALATDVDFSMVTALTIFFQIFGRQS